MWLPTVFSSHGKLVLHQATFRLHTRDGEVVSQVLFSTTQPGHYGKGSVNICSGEGPIQVRRYAISRQASHPAIRGIDTVADIFSYSAPTHGDIKASGLRDTIRVVEEKEVTEVIDRKSPRGSFRNHV